MNSLSLGGDEAMRTSSSDPNSSPSHILLQSRSTADPLPLGGQLPSERHGGQLPSEHHSGQLPSERHGGQLPSEHHGQSPPMMMRGAGDGAAYAELGGKTSYATAAPYAALADRDRDAEMAVDVQPNVKFPFNDLINLRNWPTASDQGIGISSGISESAGLESIKVGSPRGPSSSGTMPVETSVLVSSDTSANQFAPISEIKLHSIKEKLRELKALIPPPDTPEVSHTAAALQVG